MSDTEENKALVRRFFEAQSRGDLAAVEEMMALDFVNHHRGFGQQRSREDYIRDLKGSHRRSSRLLQHPLHRRRSGRRLRRRIKPLHDTGHPRPRGVAGFPAHRDGVRGALHQHPPRGGGKIAEEWREGGGLLGLTQERLEQETRERERIEQELQVARHIQQASLPKEVPTPKGWQISPLYRPAREVGGDFFDFLELEDGRLGVVVGDATGKGVPAALGWGGLGAGGRHNPPYATTFQKLNFGGPLTELPPKKSGCLRRRGALRIIGAK